MALKSRNVKIVQVRDWDSLVKKTYGRQYSFQQQRGCQDRGTVYFDVPDPDLGMEGEDAFDSIPEVVNGEKMCVKFEVWLARDPKMLAGEIKDQIDNLLFWGRNFYPPLQSVANSLHEMGLIESGEYAIEIDW